ncbi:putative lipoprotein, partial [Vibrio parahaemolyticus VPTS-2010_2]
HYGLISRLKRQTQCRWSTKM